VGKKLAVAGHSLIVESDNQDTADYHAVCGALSLLDPKSPEARIRVIGRKRSFQEARRKWPGLFSDHPVPAIARASAKVLQTRQADAVILLGGVVKTHQAGLTAASSGKPLACIGSFGGAARMLNEDFFLSSPTTWGYEGDDEKKLRKLQQEPFDDDVLRTALTVAWIESVPKLFLIHGRSTDRDDLKNYLSDELKVSQVIILAEEVTPTELITMKFERYARSVDGAIALLTPDDFGGLAALPKKIAPRSRQNVWLEVGWFWAHRGRSRLLLLRKVGSKGGPEIPSDLNGVEYYKYRRFPLDQGTKDKIRIFVEDLRFPERVAGRSAQA
jgi:predicted nucleotide-binding protein